MFKCEDVSYVYVHAGHNVNKKYICCSNKCIFITFTQKAFSILTFVRLESNVEYQMYWSGVILNESTWRYMKFTSTIGPDVLRVRKAKECDMLVNTWNVHYMRIYCLKYQQTHYLSFYLCTPIPVCVHLVPLIIELGNRHAIDVGTLELIEIELLWRLYKYFITLFKLTNIYNSIFFFY